MNNIEKLNVVLEKLQSGNYQKIQQGVNDFLSLKITCIGNNGEEIYYPDFIIKASSIKKIKDFLPIPKKCPYCGNGVEIKSHQEIYGKDYGSFPFVYACSDPAELDWESYDESFMENYKPSCGAYVGIHPFTIIPLGTLANKELRTARKTCKKPFERLYQSLRFTRGEAYKLLAKKLNIDLKDCHFGFFDIDMCRKAEIAAKEIFLGEGLCD